MSELESSRESFLEINEIGQSTSGKTKIFGVYSAKHGDELGVIQWFARWRQYTFYPKSETIWNDSCLTEIASFLNNLRKQRKRA